MADIRGILSKGLAEREQEARRVISETLNMFPGTLSAEFIASAKRVADAQFREDSYTTIAEHTAEVYQRKQAPGNRFSEQRFTHEMTLERVDDVNRRRGIVDNLHTILDEFSLAKAPSAVPNKWVARLNAAIGWEAERRGYLWLVIAFLVSTVLAVLAL